MITFIVVYLFSYSTANPITPSEDQTQSFNRTKRYEASFNFGVGFTANRNRNRPQPPYAAPYQRQYNGAYGYQPAPPYDGAPINGPYKAHNVFHGDQYVMCQPPHCNDRNGYRYLPPAGEVPQTTDMSQDTDPYEQRRRDEYERRVHEQNERSEYEKRIQEHNARQEYERQAQERNDQQREDNVNEEQQQADTDQPLHHHIHHHYHKVAPVPCKRLDRNSQCQSYKNLCYQQTVKLMCPVTCNAKLCA